jgi:Fe-S-cluster containining protein
MNNFDCSKAVPHICKADCCGCFPFHKITFELFKNKIIEKPIEINEFKNNGDEFILLLTKSGKCIFLTKNFKCNIHDDRPNICRIFGINEFLQCPHISAAGEIRNKEDKKAILLITKKRRIK